MHKFDRNNIYKNFHHNGYVVLENVIDQRIIVDMHVLIQDQLIRYSEELETDFARYTYCTGRWGPSSKLFLNAVFSDVNLLLKTTLENIFGKNISLQKQNIICKNEHIINEVPLHQDISYSYNSPYNFTLWLAIDDVLPNSGEVIVIPQSHKWPIAGAVDFWSPFFKDKKQNKYKDVITKIHLKKGDGLLFDSRLWHGSLKNLNKVTRYAHVSRWLIDNYKFTKIPKPQALNFGMWDCHSQLEKTLLNFTSPSLTGNQPSFLQLLEDTKTFVENQHILKKIDANSREKAISAVNNLIILHKASSLHDAGDLCGNIYLRIWHDLLPIILN